MEGEKMEQGILIYKDLQEVYSAVESSLRKAMKIQGELLNKESIYQMPTLKGEKKVRQIVTEEEKNKVLSFVSFLGKDQVKTTYSFRDEGDGFTHVRLKEEATSVSLLRRYNYLLFSLPILSSGAKKKLQRKLQSLKQMLEGENK